MSKPKWTIPQQNAIEDRGGGLLISAAAGSGKTAVLVERVVGIICDEVNPVDIDRLLIVTFSNAAAAEMRQRIDTKLSQLIAENPENYYLQKQQNLLSGASIQTVHAFCMNIIRDNFQNLEISPDFAIMDQQELDIMKREAVSQCIEELYSTDESGEFSQLVELLSSGRDDQRVMDTVFKVYDFARSHPFYEDWLERKLEMYDSSIPVEETVWGKTLLEYTGETLYYTKGILEQSLGYIMGDEVLEKAYQPAWESDLAQLSNLIDYGKTKDWDALVNGLKYFSFLRLGSVRGDDWQKEKAKEARDQSKKLINGLAKSYMNATRDEFAADVEDLRPKIELLFELVKNFGESLDKAKRNAKKLDFSDLEHLALRLLVKKVENNYEATTQAKEIAAHYRHLLVDEYQDTNEVQDLIFTSLSSGGDRLFMVGDVKQSIYSFRLAMPEIFLKKKEVFSNYNGVSYPATISLDTNFRSRRQVTDSINFIFSQIMSKEMGEIDYNYEETLKCGREFPDQPLAEPELLITDCEGYEGEEDATYLEAVQVAKKVKTMLENGYMVTEGESLRPAVPGDFCILMRSPRSRAQVYVKALLEQGITSQADSSGGFLSTREVSSVVSLLKALDNPLLDVELVGAMLSPLFAFSDDNIAEMRVLTKGEPFFIAVQNCAQRGDEKAERFIKTFNELRYFAASHSADELILEIFRHTNCLEIFRTMPLGEGRQANILLLIEYAAYYDSMGYKSLGGFVALLRKIVAKGGDLDGASATSKNKNTVQIMSVHRSKGLEFPVVIVADTSRQFNKRSLYENTLVHSSHGFATVRRNHGTMVQYSTVPMGAIKLEMQKTMLSEEMRILYVALTRAKEKLILSMAVKKDLAKFISKAYVGLVNGKLPSFIVGEANSYSQWILMALLHHPSFKELWALGNIDDLEVLESETAWKTEIAKAESAVKDTSSKPSEWVAESNKILLKQIEEKISYKYPHRAETLTPNKLSVSDILEREKSTQYDFMRRPKFLSEQKLTPTEKGNALHKFMQFADYASAKEDIYAEIDRMEKEQFLSPKEAESLSVDALENFFSSNIADRIFASPKVYRELRFITEFGKEELADIFEEIAEESRIVLQGVADCVFIEEGRAYIVDYKTDKVSSMEQLRERYLQQVNIYRRILAGTLEMEIGGCILYSFELSSWVEV